MLAAAAERESLLSGLSGRPQRGELRGMSEVLDPLPTLGALTAAPSVTWGHFEKPIKFQNSAIFRHFVPAFLCPPGLEKNWHAVGLSACGMTIVGCLRPTGWQNSSPPQLRTPLPVWPGAAFLPCKARLALPGSVDPAVACDPKKCAHAGGWPRRAEAPEASRKVQRDRAGRALESRFSPSRGGSKKWECSRWPHLAQMKNRCAQRWPWQICMTEELAHPAPQKVHESTPLKSPATKFPAMYDAIISRAMSAPLATATAYSSSINMRIHSRCAVETSEGTALRRFIST
jgi:hypothetical protein